MSLDHQIIPHPSNLQHRNGTFALTSEVTVRADSASQAIADDLAQALHLQKSAAAGSKQIDLALDPNQPQLGEEGYRLSIDPTNVRIRAFRPTGLFYATQTFLQLLRDNCAPAVDIEDQPRFPWRGIMLDVARHFFSVDFIKRAIDLLAFYKMNRLHLHLTDAQAWRLQITKYPLLTNPPKTDEFPAAAEGYYTHDNIRDIVAYAKRRGVMIVPEIEFPSHSDLALTAYPQFLCPNFDHHQTGWNPKEFCPGSEKMFDFAADVLSEVTALFDAPFIHVGGDEYIGMSWEKCPDCRRRIETEHLDREDSPELQAMFARCLGSHSKYLLYRYIMRRIVKIVVDKNRTPILWDDLSWQGRYPEKTVVLQWHYKDLFDYAQQTMTKNNPAVHAALAGHNAIIAAASHLYFDYFDGGRVLKRLYEFEPISPELPSHLSSRVFGPQACLWECPQQNVDRMLFPRLLALAEIGWTSKSLRNWDSFSKRLNAHLPELARRGVRAAAIPNPADISTNGLTDEWKPVWLKEWHTNDLLTQDGTYEVRVELSGSATIEKLVWTADGVELPTELCPSSTDAQKTYRFHVANMNPEVLYSLRFFSKPDANPNSIIKVKAYRTTP